MALATAGLIIDTSVHDALGRETSAAADAYLVVDNRR
jgi:hypothetical protein